jgi:hypothetical protein
LQRARFVWGFDNRAAELLVLFVLNSLTELFIDSIGLFSFRHKVFYLSGYDSGRQTIQISALEYPFCISTLFPADIPRRLKLNTIENSVDRYTAVMNDPKTKPKWRERFEFFQTNGPLTSPEAREAFKALPRGKKRLINMSWLGFFFGPFYFLCLGMWRRAITLWGVFLASIVIEIAFEAISGIEIPRAIDFGINAGFGVLYAMSVNYSYYLKEIKGDNGWHPFKGLRWR